MTGGEIEYTPLPAKHKSAVNAEPDFFHNSAEMDDLNNQFGSDWDNV